MKSKIIFLISIFIHLTCFCQNLTDEGDFGASKSCNINANDNQGWQLSTENVEGATFHYGFCSVKCTGTLLQQYSVINRIQQFFKTTNYYTNHENYLSYLSFYYKQNSIT